MEWLGAPLGIVAVGFMFWLFWDGPQKLAKARGQSAVRAKEIELNIQQLKTEEARENRLAIEAKTRSQLYGADHPTKQ